MMMTRAEVVAVIRRGALDAGSLSAYARRRGVCLSTLSNMIHGRNRFTPRVLRLLGLEQVQLVEAAAAVAARGSTPRPSRPIWKLGDWPSRYRAAAE